jgi:two-component system, LytTR family, response regulator
MTLRALVVDDEAVARRHLIRLLEPYDDIRVVGQAKNGIEAVASMREDPPDVLFLDVQMPGMDGFQVLRSLAVQPLVVFTTAHDEYALAAFKENAIEYLLKPIGPEDIDRAVRKLRTLAAGRGAPQRFVEGLLRQLESSKPPPSQILVAVRDTLKPVRLDQIVYLEARDKCTIVHTVGGAHEADIALGEFEVRLPVADFIRIHRRHIVNRQYIASLRRWGNRQLKVELTVPCPVELFVSRRCVDEVLRRLGNAA